MRTNVCISNFCNFVSYSFEICTVAKKRSLGKPKIEDNRNLHFVFVFNCLIVFDSVALYSSRNNLRGITHKSPTSPNIAIYVCKHVHLVKHFSQLKFSLSVCLIRVWCSKVEEKTWRNCWVGIPGQWSSSKGRSRRLSFPERYILFGRHDHHHKFERKGWSCNVMPFIVCNPD